MNGPRELPDDDTKIVTQTRMDTKRRRNVADRSSAKVKTKLDVKAALKKQVLNPKGGGASLVTHCFVE